MRLERIPMELLLLLIERGGELVTRDEIAARLWHDGVFVDVDHSINTAIRKIRFALHDDPDQPRYVETVVGKGYRFAAKVTSVNGQPGAHQDMSPRQAIPDAALSAPEKRASDWWRLLLGAAFALVSISIVLVWRFSAASKPAPPPAGIKSLAVLPLKNLSGDPSQDYLADGMTEALIGSLSAIHDLRVISRTSAMHFRDTNLSIPEIAKILGVDAIVEGSVIREGNRIRIHAQLIRAATDEHFWSQTYDRDLSDILALQSDVAQSIADRVETTVAGSERSKLTVANTVAPEVYENYLKGSFALHSRGSTRAGIEESIRFFEEAIRKDPTFAPSYVGVADAYNHLSTVIIGVAPGEPRRKIISAARKALELNPQLAEPHVLLADSLQKQWHWAEAETEYKLAIELDPNNAEAYAGYADWLSCQGRLEDAEAWARRGRTLDPASATGDSVSWILFLGRRNEEAIRELRRDLELQPGSAWALHTLGFALIADHRPGEAIPALEKMASVSARSPGAVSALINAYAQAGRRADALRLLEELKKSEKAGYVPPGAFVIAYLGLRDNEQTFAWLEKAYEEQSNILQFLKVHPFFDPLRSDPRFFDILRRVGLAPSQQV